MESKGTSSLLASPIGDVPISRKYSTSEKIQDRQRQVSEMCHVETEKTFPSITVVRQMDVLYCSDPEISNEHVGNIQFNHLVEYNRSIYQALPNRKRPLVARSIVDAITRAGGRFLQQKGVCLGSRNVTTWTEMNYRETIRKTLEALSGCHGSSIGAPVARLLSYKQSGPFVASSLTGFSLHDSAAENRGTAFEWDRIVSAGDETKPMSHTKNDESKNSASKTSTRKDNQGSAIFRRFNLSRRASNVRDESIAKRKVSTELLSSSSTETTSDSACSADEEDSNAGNRRWGRIPGSSGIAKGRSLGSEKISSLRDRFKGIRQAVRQNLRSRRLDPVARLHETGSSTVLTGSW